MIICPSTDLTGGGVAAESIRNLVDDHHFGRIGYVASRLGVCSFDRNGAAVEDAVGRANQVLYKAKEPGRNLVSLSNGPDDD